MWLRWEVWLPFDLLLSSEGMADGRRLNLARIFAASSAAMPDQLLPPGTSLGCEASLAHSLAGRPTGWLSVGVSVCVAACLFLILILILFLLLFVFVYWPVVSRLELTRPVLASISCPWGGTWGHELSTETELERPRGRVQRGSGNGRGKSRSCSPSARERSHMPAVGLLERRMPFDNPGNGLID